MTGVRISVRTAPQQLGLPATGELNCTPDLNDGPRVVELPAPRCAPMALKGLPIALESSIASA
eukprot:1915740-Prymnesium_polylepis.1